MMKSLNNVKDVVAPNQDQRIMWNRNSNFALTVVSGVAWVLHTQ
jgi:hypothetical protein